MLKNNKDYLKKAKENIHTNLETFIITQNLIYNHQKVLLVNRLINFNQIMKINIIKVQKDKQNNKQNNKRLYI